MFNQDTDRFRTFGRAKGKPLSQAQAKLMRDIFPQLDKASAIANNQNPFANEPGRYWLEIGFGGAEHLLWQAEQNPKITILGVEPFLNGVAKAVKGISETVYSFYFLTLGQRFVIINAGLSTKNLLRNCTGLSHQAANFALRVISFIMLIGV